MKKIKYFWNKLLGTVLLYFALTGLFSVITNGRSHTPSTVIFAMQGIIVTGGIWVTKIIWE